MLTRYYGMVLITHISLILSPLRTNSLYVIQSMRLLSLTLPAQALGICLLLTLMVHWRFTKRSYQKTFKVLRPRSYSQPMGMLIFVGWLLAMMAEGGSLQKDS